ncbi:Hypothetical_protein [Hexamita inflata]|uniref:Hypothetical_protein n=1 Tax=Hexamita inflata TaxID=28002 RepID=A0ABP1L1V2_9EUKA
MVEYETSNQFSAALQGDRDPGTYYSQLPVPARTSPVPNPKFHVCKQGAKDPKQGRVANPTSSNRRKRGLRRLALQVSPRGEQAPERTERGTRAVPKAVQNEPDHARGLTVRDPELGLRHVLIKRVSRQGSELCVIKPFLIYFQVLNDIINQQQIFLHNQSKSQHSTYKLSTEYQAKYNSKLNVTMTSFIEVHHDWETQSQVATLHKSELETE